MKMIRVNEDTWLNAELIERVDLLEDGHVHYWTVSNHTDNPDELSGDEATNFIEWLKDNDIDARPEAEMPTA